LHIYTADASIAPNADGDELVVENSGNAGISILSGNTSNGAIFFGDVQDNNVGIIDYDHNVNKMSFTTGATATPVTIDANQKIYATGGIQVGSSFGETLDSYEEGTWTPALNESGTSSTSATNRYTRIGNVVHLWGHLSNIQKDGTPTSDLEITGLPFSCEANATVGTAMTNNITTASKMVNLSVHVNTSNKLYFYQTVYNGAWVKIDWSAIEDNDDIYFHATYRTDA